MVVDLNKNVLKEHTRAFVPVFQEAQKRMRKVLQNCSINSLVMCRSIRNFDIPSPGGCREFELFKIWLFKFPATWAKNVFKCPTVIKKITRNYNTKDKKFPVTIQGI